MTVARGVVRWKQNGIFHGDDYWAFASCFFLLVMAIHYHFMVPGVYETQRYQDQEFLLAQMTPEEYGVAGVLFLKLLFSCMMFFWASLWAVKASFLCLIYRLIGGLPTYKKWWWAIVVFTIATFVASVLNNFGSCLPLWRRWSLDPLHSCQRPGQLTSTYVTIWIPTAIDIASDIAIYMMPIWILSNLMLPRSKRAGVIAMFGLSLIVVAVSIIRVVLLTGLGGNIDMVLHVTWTWTEPMVAVIIVNIPAFKAFFTRVMPSPTGAKNSYGSNGSRGFGGSKSNKHQISSAISRSSADIEMGKHEAEREGSVDSEARLHSVNISGFNPTQNKAGPGIAVTSEVSITNEPKGPSSERRGSRW